MTHMRDKRLWLAAALGVAGLGALLMPQSTVQAADHGDPFGGDPTVNPGADIADFYAWHDGTNVKFIITYAGLAAAGGDPVYRNDVSYKIHINTNAGRFGGEEGDQTDEFTIDVRFGQRPSDDAWGMQVSGIPGVATPIVGEVGGTLSEGGAMVHAGLHDDPFFFDLAGFLATATTGTLSFSSLTDDAPVDFAEGLNAMGIVVEFPISALGGATSFDAWASTAVIGG